MLKWKVLTAVVLSVAGLVALDAQAAQSGAKPSGKTYKLTTQDYIDIQQLVARYAYAIDNCTNNGLDYADLYATDGWFGASRDGRAPTNRYQGRERLAAAARGNMKTCEEVPWKGITHMLVNHVILPSPEGATGKVYLVAVGLDGNRNKVEAQGHYEDEYVKTPLGWRFKSRLHVLAAGQAPMSTGTQPAQPATPPK
jgi:hypothetical protein